jgi:hypothetical protein
MLSIESKADSGCYPHFPAAVLALLLIRTLRQYSTGYRIQTRLLPVSFGNRNLIIFKSVAFNRKTTLKNGSALFVTGTEPGCRNATAVSKAVTNQLILTAGENMIPFEMDSFPGNGSTFKAPSVVQRTDAMIIQSAFKEFCAGVTG